MRRGPLVGFLVTEVSAILAVPLGYGVAGGSCAPPGILCYARDVGCLAVCTDAWAQFPTVAAYAAVLGLAPAILVALLVLGIERRKGVRWAASRSVALPALGVVGILGTVLLVAVVFPYMGGYLVALITGFGVMLAAAFGAGWVLVERLVARRTSPSGG